MDRTRSTPSLPPRWTLPLGGPRLRVTVALVLWLAVAAWLVLGSGSGHRGVVAAVAVVVGILLSMLAHEGAHAVAAHRLGYDVQWVVLGSLGGITAYEGRDDRPLERAAIALAGPAASAAVVVALVLAGLVVSEGEVAAALDMLAIFNALALVVNLVPVSGTDGAHVLAGVVAHSRRRLATSPASPGEPKV